MRLSLFTRVLLTGALSSFLFAQQPAADLAKLRKEADAAVQSGDFGVAAAAFRKVVEADPKDGQAWQLLGYSLHAAGKLDEALPAHQKAAEFPRFAGVATYNIACVHSLKGNADQAFAWLEKAMAAGFDDLEQLRGDTDFEAIRKDPRMAKIEARLKDAPAKLAVFAESKERKSARIAWFGKTGSPGQIAFDYSPVSWNAEYEKAVASGKQKGRKWRFGGDFWTRLDTSLDMKFGATTVPAGYWYLTLEQRDGDQYVLGVHDAAAVRKQKLDAFMANKLQGGIEVALTHAKADEVASNLDIALEMKPGSQTEGLLTIRFGGHALSAPFTVTIE